MTSLFLTEPGFSEDIVEIDSARESCVDVGTALRHARETAGYSLGEVSARTRITERYLVALEASDFHVFPAALYAIGFAKTFARHVGISEGWVAATIRRQMASATIEPGRDIGAPRG